MRVFVGHDWAEAHHDVLVEDGDGRRLGGGRLPDGLEGISRFHELVAPHIGDPSEVVVATETDRGLFVGALVLLAVFAVSLPFIAARVALAVQLQTSRVLWPVEFLATVYLVWALVDAHRSGAEAGRPASWARHVAVGVAVTITVAAVARGTFTLRIEHQRPLFSYGLPPTAWTDVGAWASAQTPLDAHFLADPGHAWRYGTSFRVTARRDVFLESVKDAAMATYARPIALRVSERTEAIGDFSALSPERASDLASRYDLDFLVTDRAFPFPIAFANAQFTVYALPRR